MFLMPSLVIMSIAATRMYRSLTDFGSNNMYGVLPFHHSLRTHFDRYHHSAVNWENTPRIGRAVSNPNSTFIVPAPPKRMEVAVHMTHEKYTTSPADQNVLHVDHNRSGQPHAEQDGLSFDNDVESGM